MQKKILRYTTLNEKNSYLAFPLKNQLSADMLKNNIKLKTKILADNSININNVKFDKQTQRDLKIWALIHKVKGILNENKIAIGNNFEMEISHHKGIENFDKVGCYLFNLINKEYAKNNCNVA